MPIPLSLAHYCQDCDIIMELTEQGTCPNCTGKGVLALARVLNRDAHDLTDNPRGYCPDCGADLGRFYSNRIRFVRGTGETNDESNTK